MTDKQVNMPVYLHIYNELKKRIIEKKFIYGEFLPSERLLSEEFSVERATVRRSLELLVKEKYLVKIPGSGTKVIFNVTQKEIQGMDYSNSNIAFILPSDTNDKITQPFISGIFHNLEIECRRENYNLIYAGLTSDDTLPGILTSKNVKGIIWVSRIAESHIIQLKQLGIASVLISNSIQGFTSVLVDNIGGSFEAADYLIKLGHRDIVFINGISGYLNSVERFDGFRRALCNSGIELNQKNIIEGDWTFEGGYAAMNSIFKRSVKPTAVFAANDMMALGAIKAIREAGLDTPSNISVIGFDDIDQGKYFVPPLTTISTDVVQIAKQSIKVLMETINDLNLSPLKVIIPTHLVIRESARSLET
jgi:Transcriptional regulators